MDMNRGETGILIVGHGTTSVVGAEECRRVAVMTAEMLSELPVELGFLELIPPTIDDAVGALTAAGCSELVVVPLLLFAAGHARRDVPEAVREAAAHRGMRIRQADVLGCHDAIVELARQRHDEAAVGLGGSRAAAHRRVVMVGRGSSDPTAASQLRGFAECVFGPTVFGPTGEVGLGFVAAARPTLDEAIERAVRELAAVGRGRVIVHPHLLFHGHVEEQVTERVGRARNDTPWLEWIVVPRLGADPRVARAVAERARQAISAGADPASVRRGFDLA